MKQTLAVVALVSSSAAIKTPDGKPLYPSEFHFNEDPHSVPSPIAGKPYMTSTQAKYYVKDTWDTDTEDTSINPLYHKDFNWHAREPTQADSYWTNKWGKEQLFAQIKDKEDSDSDSDSGSDSDSDSDDEPEKKPENKANVQTKWQQSADFGELDDHSTLYREWDNPDYLEKMKPKFSGWTNPLSWVDSGNDDDLVLMQLTADGIKERRISDKTLLQIQYEESEGPTKVDLGDCDMHVIGREKDNDYEIGKKKFHGWSNPLGWQDDGEDDGVVI